MKNKNLLLQNLLGFTSIILCWLLFFFSDYASDYPFSNYILLWFLSLFYQIFFLSIFFIRIIKIKKGVSAVKTDKIFKLISFIFVLIFALPLFVDIIYEIYNIFSYNEFNLSPYQHILLYISSCDSSTFKQVGDWLVHSIPYAFVIVLISLSIKFNKKIYK